MTKHLLALGIYQKKLLKKFINYKNETQNHINSTIFPKIHKFYNLWIFYVLKPHFIENLPQKPLLFESSSNHIRVCFGKRVLFPNKTRTWFDFDSTLTATKFIKFIVLRFWMKKNISKKFFFSPTLKVGKISWKFYQNYTF